MDLLGELGALMYGPRLLLSSPLGRVEAFAVALSMLLDVLVLGHAGVLGAAAAASLESSGVAACVLQTAALSGATVLTASAGYFAAGARVWDGCGDFLMRCTFERSGEPCVWQG